MPASILLLAALTWAVGATWDIQWHSDVGPDTFFTLPHLFIYASAAISGFTGLAVILATTSAGRRGRAVDPALGGPGIGVFGRTFTAPLGYLVTSLGAASFLLYGLWDLWWHSLYGFDAVIDSPPHIGLFLSSTVTSVGTVIVFAAAREQLWGRLGALACLGHLVTSSVITALAVRQLSTGTVRWTTAVTAFIVVMLVFTGAGFRRWGATIVAGTAAAMQAVFWWFAPWAAQTYAEFVGLPMRENNEIIPSTPALIPMCLLPVGVVVDLLLRRTGGTARLLPGLVGGLGGLIIAGCAPWQTVLIYDSRLPAATVIVATVVAGAVLGGIGGFLGWRFGAMLRRTAPEGARA
ncbi:hypothetical protein [Nocardia wallacei]|uniref:hypothetical protein n=1 Tax=Nocardia wallacei TaxID=480035 RepID=UPI002456F612|nr:hypothetical protein [Nocardia wallacei]